MNIKKGIAYVFLATGIGFIINIITSFVFPKILSIEAYANVKLYQLYVTYVGIMHLGFSDGMYLRLGGKKIDELNKKELISEFNTFKLFQLIINIAFIAISIIIKDFVLLFVAVSMMPINVINYLRSLYQATGLYEWYSGFLTTNNIMLFTINMILLFVVKTDNAYVYIIGQTIVYFINWLLIETAIKIKFFKKVKAKPDISFLINDIKDGILLMLGNFCTIIFTSIDRMYSKVLLGIKYFAFYSFAVSVEGLLNVFITPIVVTLYNYLCIHNDSYKVKKIKRIILMFTMVMLSSAFPVKFVIDNYIIKYKEASNIIFILFAAQFFSIIVRTIHNNLYKSKKRQDKYFKIIIVVTMIAIVLDYISYRINKSNEAFAIATLITCLIWFVIGEIDFKEYRYKKNDYFIMTIITLSFLYTGVFVKNAILGMIIYVVICSVLIFAFMKTELIYVFSEIMKEFKKFFNNKNEVGRKSV